MQINIEKIGLNIVSKDIENIKSSLSQESNNEQLFIDYINELDGLSNINDIVIFTGKKFDEFASYKIFDKAFIIQSLLQRYTYLLITKKDFEMFYNQFEVHEMDQNMLIRDVVIPFFSEQINFYTNSLSEIILDFNLREWNNDFSIMLFKEIDSILKTNDLPEKIQLTEKLAFIFENENELIKILKLNIDDEGEAKKEAFIIKISEIKIVFQTMNFLIQLILKEIIEE